MLSSFYVDTLIALHQEMYYHNYLKIFAIFRFCDNKVDIFVFNKNNIINF